MPRLSPPQVSHASGEISQLLYGRPDFARHQSGVAEMRGFIPLVEGAALRTPGTRYIGETRNNAVARLMPAELYDSDNYMLEWSDTALRFWREEAVVAPGGSDLVITTSTAEADLDLIQGLPSADRFYTVDSVNHPQRLTRNAVDAWSIENTPFENGPFLPANQVESHTITASAATGSITLTATANTFEADHVGALFMLTEVDKDEVPEWLPGVNQSEGDRMRSNGIVYEIASFDGGATTASVGSVRPVHTEGAALSQPSGPVWQYIHNGSGIVRIDAVTDALNATATVLREMPENTISPKTTYRWREGAWSAKRGYPAALTEYAQRHIYGGGFSTPLQVEWTRIGDFQNLEPSTLADGAYSFQAPPPSRRISRIRWIEPNDKFLHAGTGAGEVVIRSTNEGQGFTLETTRFSPGTAKGTGTVQAVNVDGRPVFADPAGRRLYGLDFSFEVDRVVADALTLAARHILQGRVRWMSWQEHPVRLLWIGLKSGELISLTYEPEQGAFGFAKHPVAGDVISGAVKRTDDNTSQQLWLIVERTIGGATRRHVEILADFYGIEDPPDVPPSIEDAWQLYAAVRYQGTATSIIAGLDHLEGRSVYAWTEFGSIGPLVVVSGQIDLGKDVTSAIVGLDVSDEQRIKYLDLQPGAADGGSDGRNKVVRGVAVKLLHTAGGTVRTVQPNSKGVVEKSPTNRLLRTAERRFEDAKLFSGVVDVDPKFGWSTDAAIEIQPEPGAPLNCLGPTPTLQVTDN